MRRPLAVAFCALALGSCGTNGASTVPYGEVPVVSSAKPDKNRIEQAKRDWQDERFPLVPGDEHERVPL